MAEVTVYGLPQSNFVRVARMTCLEKGVSYTLEKLAPHSPEILALNPHGKIPAFTHGNLTLYETSAIARYIDEAFDGPRLQPEDLRERAVMNQWISAANHYYDRSMIREYVVQRLVVPSRGGTPDEDMIAAALPNIEKQLDVAEKTLAESEFLAGSQLTLADLFMVPIIFYVGLPPEGAKLCGKCKSVNRWLEAMSTRESFKKTAPPAPKKDAA